MQEREMIKDIQKKKMDFISDRDATASFYREQEWLKLLAEGRLTQWEGVQWEDTLGPETMYNEAVLTYKGDLKQLEYNLVAVITLGCRAIIAGGVDPFEAYRISDIYLQQLSECTQMEEMIWIANQVMKEYHLLVEKKISDKQASGSQDVENAKVYICRHLRGPLTMQEVCHAIGVSEGHLSAKFREEGTTFRKYVQKERLIRSANILVQTEEPVNVISDYLGFSTPSYFGSCFLKKYGCTPLEYRKRNKFCLN